LLFCEHACLPAFLSSYLPACPMFDPACMSAHLPICPSVRLPACLPSRESAEQQQELAYLKMQLQKLKASVLGRGQSGGPQLIDTTLGSPQGRKVTDQGQQSEHGTGRQQGEQQQQRQQPQAGTSGKAAAAAAAAAMRVQQMIQAQASEGGTLSPTMKVDEAEEADVDGWDNEAMDADGSSSSRSSTRSSSSISPWSSPMKRTGQQGVHRDHHHQQQQTAAAADWTEQSPPRTVAASVGAAPGGKPAAAGRDAIPAAAAQPSGTSAVQEREGKQLRQLHVTAAAGSGGTGEKERVDGKLASQHGGGSSSSSKGNNERSHAAGGGGGAMAEVRRLLREKAELLATGLYSREDSLLKQIDTRIQQVVEQQQHPQQQPQHQQQQPMALAVA
jgi:hypothetical protein